MEKISSRFCSLKLATSNDSPFLTAFPFTALLPLSKSIILDFVAFSTTADSSSASFLDWSK